MSLGEIREQGRLHLPRIFDISPTKFTRLGLPGIKISSYIHSSQKMISCKLSNLIHDYCMCSCSHMWDGKVQITMYRNDNFSKRLNENAPMLRKKS